MTAIPLEITVPEDGVVTLPAELRGSRIVVHREGKMARFIRVCKELKMPAMTDEEIEHARAERILERYNRSSSQETSQEELSGV
ncbi:MAG: hypothetical protein ACRC46_05890 [Thermoguttaceae bacterium]